MVVTTQAARRRLDLLMVDRRLASSRERAQAMIAAGLVEVDGVRARSAAQAVAETAELRLLDSGSAWASRAGEKLTAGLDAFGVECRGRVCLDAGASTGGFTDVLLSRGAAAVYAVDVGRGQLISRLATDPRVTVLDRTNLRHLSRLPGAAPSLVTLDLSFISLRVVLGSVAGLAPAAEVVALFKPQFEMGRSAVGRGGIVRNQDAAAVAARDFLAWSESQLGAAVAHEPVPAPIRGAKGNQEWLVHLRLPGTLGVDR